MGHWIQHPLVSEYSISADWDDKWRHGGNLEEVIEEAHLSADWQIKGIERFAKDRKKRIKTLKRNIPVDLLEKMAECVGISSKTLKENQNNSGGAQYLLKNIEW